MKNTKLSIITRSASALTILAVLVLFVSAPLGAKSYRPNDKDDDKDRKESTTTQTVRSERSESKESHSSAPRENSWRPGNNERNSSAPPPVTTTSQPTVIAPSGNNYRPRDNANGNGNGSGYRPDNGGTQNNRPPSTSTYRVDRTPDTAPVSTYRPHSDDNSNNRREAKTESSYRPNSDGGSSQRTDREPKGTYRPRTEPTVIRRSDPPKIESTYRPNTNTGGSGQRTDREPKGTYRPRTEPTVVHLPDPPKVGPTYRPSPKTDIPRNGVGDRDNRGPGTNPGTTYRPNPGGNNNRDRDNNNDNRTITTRRPSSRPSFDLSHRTPGVSVTYRPSSNTSYRLRLGTGYYRPATVSVDHSRVWSHYAPRDYKPAGFSRGHYYYPRHSHHHHYSRPHYYGYWVFDLFPRFSVRSCYYHYGYYPYVQVTRVYETSYPEVVYVGGPVYTSGSYYLQDYRYKDLDVALGDIRSSWISGRYDLIERHVMPNDKIAIFLDGEYDYSIDGEDYLAMTRDALEELQTASFVWDNVRRRDDNTVTAFATHKYYGESNDIKTVYVSYTLDKIGSSYYLVEVGSSNEPLY